MATTTALPPESLADELEALAALADAQGLRRAGVAVRQLNIALGPDADALDPFTLPPLMALWHSIPEDERRSLLARFLRQAMRANRVTVSALAEKMEISQERVREVRRDGIPPAGQNACWIGWVADWVEGVASSRDVEGKEADMDKQRVITHNLVTEDGTVMLADATARQIEEWYKANPEWWGIRYHGPKDEFGIGRDIVIEPFESDNAKGSDLE